MLQQKRSIGRHNVYQLDSSRYGFVDMLKKLYEVDSLYELQEKSIDYASYPPGTLQDVETDIHKKFYKFIKSEDTFKLAYQRLIRDIYTEFFPNDPVLLYQTFPSIRFQFVGNKAVPKHCDSDSIGNHPLGERNFLLPLTRMEKSNRLFLESEPEKGDFQGIDLEEGELLYFDGNKCIHYNEINQESYMRISFDFRILRLEDYLKNTQVTFTNPRNTDRIPVKMVVGGYYQCMFPYEESIVHTKPSFIFQTRPNFDKSEGDACSHYFQNGDPFLTEFKETEALEKALCEYIGTRHCFMVPSGTAALLVALLAAGIQPGDDVIVPNYTMIATANAVRGLGANAILVDVHPETYTLDLETVKRHVTLQTKAILHVSLNNRSHGLTDLVSFCKEKSIVLIEDAAQSLGCKLNRRHYGTFGDIGCFSLSPAKIITTGQGGFVITDNDELAHKIRCMKNFGRRSGGEDVYEMFGLNFKFTDIQAVIGLAQMKKLPERVTFMRNLYEMYAKRLSGLRYIRLLPSMNEEWIPWFIDIYTPYRDELQTFLKQHDVQTRVVYPSIHTTTPKVSGNFPHSLDISSNGLFLPTHTRLTEKEVDYICLLLRIFDAHCGQKVVVT